MEYNLSTKMKPAYRTRSLSNLLRMGHCAPAVMQTILRDQRQQAGWAGQIDGRYAWRHLAILGLNAALLHLHWSFWAFATV